MFIRLHFICTCLGYKFFKCAIEKFTLWLLYDFHNIVAHFKINCITINLIRVALTFELNEIFLPSVRCGKKVMILVIVNDQPIAVVERPGCRYEYPPLAHIEFQLLSTWFFLVVYFFWLIKFQYTVPETFQI